MVRLPPKNDPGMGVIEPQGELWERIRRSYGKRTTESVEVIFTPMNATRRVRVHALFAFPIDIERDNLNSSIKNKLQFVRAWTISWQRREEPYYFDRHAPEWNLVVSFAAKGVSTKRRSHGIQKDFGF